MTPLSPAPVEPRHLEAANRIGNEVLGGKVVPFMTFEKLTDSVARLLAETEQATKAWAAGKAREFDMGDLGGAYAEKIADAIETGRVGE